MFPQPQEAFVGLVCDILDPIVTSVLLDRILLVITMVPLNYLGLIA